MLVLGGCIHNDGYLKVVALQPEPVLGPEIAFFWELMYKKPPIGAVVYISLYDVVSRRLYP